MVDDTRAHVIDAVESGRLPRAGPTDAAAHDLLDELPGSYWQDWSDNAAERIRAKAERPACVCGAFRKPDFADGRCERCWGWPT
jgi:hypothetical protein